MSPLDKAPHSVQLSECGTFIESAESFHLLSVPWFPFLGPEGCKRLKKYITFATKASPPAVLLKARAEQWKFLAAAPELLPFLVNRTTPFSGTITPAYIGNLTALTHLSGSLPPPLLGYNVTPQSLLSKRFAERVVSREDLDRDSRLLQVHGVTENQLRMNKLITTKVKPEDEKSFLKRDEEFQISFPTFSIPGDKRSARQVSVRHFRELIYCFAGLEKEEKDLPKKSYKLVQTWTNLKGQKSFSEMRRLVLCHSFGSSWSMVVMLLQFLKSIDSLVQDSGASISRSPEYEKMLKASGYVADLARKMETYHETFFTATTWNSLSGAQKIKMIQKFYRTFSCMSSDVPVPFTESKLLDFAPIKVIEKWAPIFKGYNRRHLGSLLHQSSLTKEHELPTNFHQRTSRPHNSRPQTNRIHSRGRNNYRRPNNHRRPQQRPRNIGHSPVTRAQRSRGRGRRGRGRGRRRGRGRGRGRGRKRPAPNDARGFQSAKRRRANPPAS